MSDDKLKEEREKAKMEKEFAISNFSGKNPFKFSVKRFFSFWIFMLFSIFFITPLIIGMISSGLVSFNNLFINIISFFISVLIIGFCIFNKSIIPFEMDNILQFNKRKIDNKLTNIFFIIMIILTIILIISFSTYMNELIMNCVFWSSILTIILTISYSLKTILNPNKEVTYEREGKYYSRSEAEEFVNDKNEEGSNNG